MERCWAIQRKKCPTFLEVRCSTSTVIQHFLRWLYHCSTSTERITLEMGGTATAKTFKFILINLAHLTYHMFKQW